MILALLVACEPPRDCGTALYWVGEAERVSAVGAWNGWNPDATQLVRDEQGTWRAQVHLDAGDYPYLLLVDGVEEIDPFQPLIDYSTGEERSLLRVRECDEPRLSLDLAESDADSLLVEATLDVPVATASAIINGEPLDVQIEGQQLRVEANDLAPGKHTVTLLATDESGRDTALRVPLWIEPEPWDGRDALIYQVVVDRFRGNDGALVARGPGERHGGTLRGVTNAIESGYLAELGANTLWLSPLLDNPDGDWPGDDGHDYSSYHGYWPVSANDIEPELGTASDLRALVSAAHARGFRVLVDVVPNHVHEEHPYRAEHGSDWFHEGAECICGDYACPWSSEIETCWFTDYLPDLSWENPEVAATVGRDIVEFAIAYDLDGLRIDAVPMLRRHAVRELVYQLAAATEQGPVDFYALGETYTGLDGHADIRMNLGPFGLDGQFDFPAMWALRALVAESSGDTAAFDAVVAQGEAAWDGSGSVMAPILGNHDTTRIASAIEGNDGQDPWSAPPPQPASDEVYDRVFLATALQFFMPGAPVLYYGDEVGLAGADDPDNRRPLPADEDLSAAQLELRDRVGALGRARACLPAMRRGSRDTLLAEGPALLWRRSGDDPVYLYANAGPAPLSPEGLDESLVDLFDPDLDPRRVLDPWSARILVSPGSPCLGGAS